MAQANDTHSNAICPSCGALPCDQTNVPADGWQAGEIALKVFFRDEVKPLPVAGWVKGLFGLDARVFKLDDDDLATGFVLTHLPTGFVIRQLHCNLAEAKRIVDEIAASPHWGFHDASNRQSLDATAPTVLAVMNANPEVVFGGNYARAFGPAA